MTFCCSGNPSQLNQVGKPLHTYTPTSHENLIKSQLQLDAANQAKLQNELRRLRDENDRLKSDLDKARKDIGDKNNLINILNNELKDKHALWPEQSSIKSYQTPTPYEVDGKPLSLDALIDHFNVILQRHHELLNRKNNEIRDLKDEIDRNLPRSAPPTRAIETQSSMPNNEDLHQNLMNEFTNQIAIIKNEYEQVENILTYRNNKLEDLIEELQRKLDQYSKEIEKLRKELASRETQPSESTVQLLWEKEKENKHLRELLENLRQTPDNFGIRKIIADKESAVDKINDIISQLKKDPISKQHLPDVGKDCQSIISDLAKTNDKLNDVIKKIKDSKAESKDKLNIGDLVPKLESLKKQCQDEINVLNDHLKSIQNKPFYFKDEIPEFSNAYIPKKDEQINLTHPLDNISQSPSKMTVSFVPKEQPKVLLKSPVLSTITSSGTIPKFEPVHKHQHFPVEPCEACNDADYLSPRWKELPITALEPLPSKTSDSKRKLIKDFYPPSPRALSKEKSKPNKNKRGCCGKQDSEISSYPYERNNQENFPQNQSYGNPNFEKIVKVHSPHNINENTKIHINPIVPNKDFNHSKGVVIKNFNVK